MIGIKTDTIVHDVLATLDVIIGRATLGTILHEEVLSNNEKILNSSP
jgi:ABC-type proline/glycine betaine transport system permease subunit